MPNGSPSPLESPERYNLLLAIIAMTLTAGFLDIGDYAGLFFVFVFLSASFVFAWVAEDGWSNVGGDGTDG